MTTKIFLIGIDGATFDVLKPLAREGLIPNISRLMEEGLHGELRSTIHPITPQAWSTFLTGKNAGKHGIFDFMARKKGSYDIEFVNASFRKGATIFSYLSTTGLEVGAVAVPFTYPPERVRGFMLSGFDAPSEDERAVYPEGLFEDIKERFGNYYIHLASPVGRAKDEDRFWQDIRTEDRNRTDICRYLLTKKNPDLFMVVYNNVDRVQHQYLTEGYLDALNNGTSGWRDELLTRTYVNVDREIGRLLEGTDGRTLVILMSDHGSGPIKRVFFLNRWLEKEGFLSYRNSTSMGFQALEMARYMSKRFLPRRAKGFIKSFLPGMRDRVESLRYFSEIDWKNTRAYSFGMYGNIYINLKGREPLGTVPPEDFKKVLNEISKRLGDLRDPDTGEKLIEGVYRKEELYSGPFVDGAPDLVIRWKDYSCYTSTSPGREKGGLFGGHLMIDSSGFRHVGTHRLEGIFVASGDMIRKKAAIKGACIVDLAPTILFALDRPIPREMDGRVLMDIFKDEFLKGRRPRFVSLDKDGTEGKRQKGYTEDEARDVEERLKGLGYL